MLRAKKCSYIVRYKTALYYATTAYLGKIVTVIIFKAGCGSQTNSLHRYHHDKLWRTQNNFEY